MIVLKIKPEIRLKGDTWMSAQEWDEEFKDNLPALVELLNEDWMSVIEEAGGLEGLIVSAEWQEEAE